MTQLNRRYAETLAILMIVAVAPASIAFAQTASVDGETNTDVNTSNTDVNTQAKADVTAKLQAKLDKRIVLAQDKLDKRIDSAKVKIDERSANTDVAKRAIVDVLSNDNQRTDLSFRGQTEGWAVVGGIASKSTIDLKGEAHRADGGTWKIKATGNIMVGDRSAIVDLTGFAYGHNIHLYGTGTLASGDQVRVALHGNFAPTGETNVFAIAFSNAGVISKSLDNGIRVPLMQVGSVTVSDITTSTTAAQ